MSGATICAAMLSFTKSMLDRDICWVSVLSVGSASGGGGDSILYQSISSDTTINVSSKVVLVDTSSGDVTVTLPPVAQTARKEYHIKKDDASSNVVTVDPSGSETIDGETTETIIGSYTSLRLYSTGTKWVII